MKIFRNFWHFSHIFLLFSEKHYAWFELKSFRDENWKEFKREIYLAHKKREEKGKKINMDHIFK